MYMYMHLVYVEARRSVGSSETGHSDDCELPCVCVCVCAGNQTWVFQEQ